MRRWEEFPVGPRDVSREMHVTLNRKGEILIGAKAYREFGEPEVAVLLFDWDNKTIGIKPATTRAKNAYRLMGKSSSHGHRTIRASRFCTHWCIRVVATMAFNNPVIDEQGVLVLDMKDIRYAGKQLPVMK